MRKTEKRTKQTPRGQMHTYNFFFLSYSLLLLCPPLRIAITAAPRTSWTRIKAYFRCRSLLESAEVYRKKAFFDLIGFLYNVDTYTRVHLRNNSGADSKAHNASTTRGNVPSFSLLRFCIIHTDVSLAKPLVGTWVRYVNREINNYRVQHLYLFCLKIVLPTGFYSCIRQILLPSRRVLFLHHPSSMRPNNIMSYKLAD